jgi:hypothetical protein
MHLSDSVHELPSLQALPFGLLVPGWQLPPLHTSPMVQLLPSSHSASLVQAVAGAGDGTIARMVHAANTATRRRLEPSARFMTFLL